MKVRPRNAGLAAAIAVIGACASGPPAAPAAADGWAPPAGQRCGRVSGEGAALPPVDEVVDSLGLAEAAAGWTGRGGAHVLYSIRYDSAGAPEAIHAIESSLPPDGSADLAGRVRRVLLPKAENAPRLLRLRLGLAGQVSAAVEASEFCPPALANRVEVGRLLEGVARALAISGTARVRLRVGADGVPLEVAIGESSGDPDLDGQILGVAMQMRFHPGLADRIPLPLWSEVPVTVGP